MPSTKYWYLTNDAWATFAKEKYECRPVSKRKEATMTAMVTGIMVLDALEM